MYNDVYLTDFIHINSDLKYVFLILKFLKMKQLLLEIKVIQQG